MSFPYDDVIDLIDRAARSAEDGATVSARMQLAQARQLIDTGLRDGEHPPTRRVYLDCEFLPGLTTPAGLISIGLTDDRGRDYYAVNGEMDCVSVFSDPFLQQHVLPFVPKVPSKDEVDWACPEVKSLGQIRRDVAAYFDTDADTVLYAFYGAADLMRLHSLWGHNWQVMPASVPRWLDDLKALAVRAGSPSMPQQQVGEHHALEDARYNRTMHEALIALGAG
ncbi:hypothetical protein AB0O47_32515 [Streptomyces noursei]|uniref:hypothetical protein n=1 Tax=Streptomyces noursei TaxID=1971 RepID=UPI00344E433A